MAGTWGVPAISSRETAVLVLDLGPDADGVELDAHRHAKCRAGDGGAVGLLVVGVDVVGREAQQAVGVPVQAEGIAGLLTAIDRPRLGGEGAADDVRRVSARLKGSSRKGRSPARIGIQGSSERIGSASSSVVNSCAPISFTAQTWSRSAAPRNCVAHAMSQIRAVLSDRMALGVWDYFGSGSSAIQMGMEKLPICANGLKKVVRRGSPVTGRLTRRKPNLQVLRG